MPFVGAAVLPHGALTFDGNPDSESEACRERHSKLPDNIKAKFEDLYNGCVAAGRFVSDLEPDIVILHTPHGIKLTESSVVYITELSRGSALWSDNWAEFQVELKTDAFMASQLVEHMKKEGVNMQGLIGHGGLVPVPLAWGEVIPAYFVRKQAKKEMKFLVISHAKRPGGINDDTLRMGKSLANFIDGNIRDSRVAVVISGDLSHTYEPEYKDNPIYLPIPKVQDMLRPRDTYARQFERTIKGWVYGSDNSLRDTEAPLQAQPQRTDWEADCAQAWLHDATKLQPFAQSCGLNGFAVLHGILSHYISKGTRISSSLHTCQAPTYYGLMAATFSLLE